MGVRDIAGWEAFSRGYGTNNAESLIEGMFDKFRRGRHKARDAMLSEALSGYQMELCVHVPSGPLIDHPMANCAASAVLHGALGYRNRAAISRANRFARLPGEKSPHSADFPWHSARRRLRLTRLSRASACDYNRQPEQPIRSARSARSLRAGRNTNLIAPQAHPSRTAPRMLIPTEPIGSIPRTPEGVATSYKVASRRRDMAFANFRASERDTGLATEMLGGAG
jgi:hypothetical protein